MTAKPEIVLDLSRLLSRVLHTAPTGVDRCEMAYSRGLLAAVPERLSFAAVHPLGVYGRLPREAVLRFLDATEARWEHGAAGSMWEKRHFATRFMAALRPRHIPSSSSKRRIYLQPSPNNLTRPRFVRSILLREQAKLICLVHDLIPLEFPEYARPNGAAFHARRIDTIARLADGVVANSHATLAALRPHLARVGRTPAEVVAHLGVERRSQSVRSTDSRPYFVAIGTIEPRKNHLLLLNLWRRMSERRGALACPRLLVIGRRGWENEQVVDMLERCPALVGCVEELGSLPDCHAQALLAGARALLLPSFAEGYGMPVTEALALGVPVICSDLPALREAGGDVPDYLDCLDGMAWNGAIEDYSETDSVSRRAQIARMTGWAMPTWRSHVEHVLKMADTISQ